MSESWRKLRSTALGDYRIFTVRADVKVSPRTGKEHDFFVIDAVNWVNVVALTAEGQVIMVRQYRHGSNTVELEIPGGMMDAHDVSPEAAACRELREETGYVGENPIIIGKVFPNPAIMSNTCFTVLVKNCRCTKPVQFDTTEDVITKLVPVEQLAGLVAENKISHSLVVAALYHFDLWRRRKSVA
jgi:8-oxo-dGTP pyrophosphatase MutT (NUDIX family)